MTGAKSEIAYLGQPRFFRSVKGGNHNVSNNSRPIKAADGSRNTILEEFLLFFSMA